MGEVAADGDWPQKQHSVCTLSILYLALMFSFFQRKRTVSANLPGSNAPIEIVLRCVDLHRRRLSAHPTCAVAAASCLRMGRGI
jgi:hypothetical protein